MSDSPDLILPRVERFATGDAYVIQWIKASLQKTELPEFDKSRLNGRSDDKKLVEAIDSLKLAHGMGGSATAKDAWFKNIAETIPYIADIVNQPQKLFHADEIEAFAPLKWLIGYEIPERGYAVLYGQPGSGKSFKALDSACKLAGRGQTVVYIAAEGRTGYKKRLQAWKKFHEQDKSGPLYFYFDEVHMTDSNQVERFIVDIQFVRPSLVIVDTLARCMGDGDENSTRDMNRFNSGIGTIQKELNTACLIVHHTLKGGNTERGSSALRGAADVMLEMRDNDGVISLVNTKMKDGSQPQLQKYRLELVELETGETSCVLQPAALVKIDPSKLTNNQRAILAQLASYSFNQGARSAELQRASEVNGSSFYHTMNSLNKRGLVEKEGKYDPWVLTYEGQSVVKRLRIED